MARWLPFATGAATLSVLALSGTSWAADCYIDNVGGSDTNGDGSESKPWASISKIGSSCTTVKFKRGNVYKLAAGVKNLGITNINSVKTLTNFGDASLPLPQFVKDHVNGSGGMLQVFSAVTIDGLYLAGSKSANSMSNLADGIGVMLGAGSTIQNCEITLCDIGMMTSGDNVKVLNNYVHDLSISVDAAPGVDPNLVGGAEGIFVNSSHVEVAYNRFVNCSTAAQWVSNTNSGGVRCDGGATEVTVPYAGEVTDVHIHHNFSYNGCGFFEVSSMANSSGSGTFTKGKFTNSEFHDNVMVDSGWISLLQINNTKLTNVRWENNTIVHHFLPTVTDANGTTIDMNDFASSYIQVIAFNSTSSGVTGGGELSQGDVYWTNNLWYFDPQIFKKYPSTGVDATHASSDQFIKNVVIAGDKFFTTDPGFVDVTSTTDPRAYDLKQGSQAIDVGVSNSDITKDVPTDYLDRSRPVGNAYDLGAFEYGASGGNTSTGGALSTGGANSAAAGGSAPGVVSSSPTGTGGAATGPTNTATTSPAVDQGGCSCRVAGRNARTSTVGWVALLMLGWGLRRSRTRE